MFPRILPLLFAVLLAVPALADEIDCVTTEWKLLGANHKVCVYAFEDPDIPGVTCYLSQARTGGISGAVGVAEDPSEFSIDCRQTGQAAVPDKLPKSKKVFSEGTSVLFKDTTVTRMWDAKRKALIYLAISRKIIAGSPKNSLSTVVLR
ncbi:CreA family protein [Fundidesulfovibrio agrisoli]|uniref:CreA family protein n=1 Tax=Fundidesulfovibrio agrisoli TaxID=2922717 RepID=UPI001FACDA20|nr:CreA family protein [Fundidesulfovibrio agrisoli]